MGLLTGQSPTRFSQYTVDQLTGNGSQTVFTLTRQPPAPSSIIITVDGVKQHSNTYSVSSYSLTFTEAPPSGSAIEVVHINSQGVSMTAGDSTITTPKIVDKNVTSAKLEDNVTITSLGIGTSPSGTSGEIRAANAITSYYSDERLKTRISDINNALDKVMQLTGFLYVENGVAQSLGFNNTKTQVALSAQDVQRVQPEAVQPAPFDTNSDGSSISGENYLTVQYEKLIPLIVEAIKELKQQVDDLKVK